MFRTPFTEAGTHDDLARGPPGLSLCGNFLRRKGWAHLTFRFFPAEGIHPFDCFLSSLPTEGHKLSLEKPTDVGG